MDKNQHITGQQLDYFVAAPDSLTAEERAIIQAHVDTCRLCREHLNAVQGFYRELGERLAQPPSARDKELAEKLLKPKKPKLLPSDALIRAYAEIVQEPRPRWPRRIVQYAHRHPATTAAGVVAFAALVALVGVMTKPTVDLNPAYALIKDQTLYVYNKSRTVLWTKGAEGMRDWPQSTNEYWPFNHEYYLKSDDAGSFFPLRVFDIDGDGINEVLVSSGPTTDHSPAFVYDTLYCFNSNGSLRWTYGVDRRGIRFGSADFSGPALWRVNRYLRVRRTPDATVQLFLVVRHIPSWPNRILELDPKTGRELQSYWHAGGIGLAVASDIDGDGVTELIFGGINNGFNQACIIVMDPREVSGRGPTSPNLRPQELPAGPEKYYLLIPRTDILESDDPYNSVIQLTARDGGGVVIQTNEGSRSSREPQGQFHGIVYSFDGQMRLSSVVASSPFEKTLERAEREGLIKNFRLDEAFYNRLRDSMRYWNGESFVREPVMNRRYRELVMR